MDKQKQIEDKKQLIEILKNSGSIVTYQPNAYKLLTLNGNDKKFFVNSNDGNVTIHFDKIVDEIYKQGYQKIPEGSVVIPEKITEETSPETLIKSAKYNEKVRKQAVKEVLKEIDKELYETSRIYLEAVAKDSKNDEAMDKYGVMTIAHKIVCEMANKYEVEL